MFYNAEQQKQSYHYIKSTVKMFRLMELLVTKNEFQISQLSRLLEIPKTTVYRMILTLESLGYVRQNPQTLGYMASLKIFHLGVQVIKNLNFAEIAKPLMIKLSNRTGENTNLGILDNDDIICIDKVESNQHLRLDQPIGSRAKAYQTGMGKAILAYLTEDERALLFSKYGISPGTSKSLKTVSAVEEDLQRVRERGYSVDNEEGIIGVRCVGAPIFDYNSKVIAGLSIAGPAFRIKENDIKPLAKLVKETAVSISSRLGVHVEGSEKDSE